MQSQIAYSLLTLVAVSFTSAVHAETGIAWQHDLEAAKQQAAAEGKLLLVHFWTPSCGPCRVLDQSVFNQQSVAQVVATSYVPVKLNANEFAATATTMGITRVPTDVVLTPDGQVVTKFVSQQTPMAYITQVNKVAQDYKSVQGRSFQTASNPGTSIPVNPAYAGLSQPTQPSPQTAGVGVTTNNFYATPAPPANNVAQVPAVDPTANRYALNQQPPATTDNPHVAAPPVSTPPQAAPPANKLAATEPPKPPAITLPPGSPPLGFEGFCPVTMRKEWKWQQGDVRWGAVHRGRTYIFASQEARDEFLKPGMADQFSPVLGGIDPVLAIDSQQQVAGLRQFAVEYRGQFYLFSSEATLSQFWTSADRYASGVYQAMNAPAPANYR